MAFDFAALKSEVRQAVHDVLAVSAVYSDSVVLEPVEITVRFHTKIDRFGDLTEAGWSEVVENINRVILNVPQLDELNITPRRGGVIQMTGTGFDGVQLILNVQEADTGPIEEIWQVTLP
ncbi:MAG: hypothetical protein KDG50_07035 [Chromatiales bacterium]|nr:hypothetical protein [Chromatiales bacterium]